MSRYITASKVAQLVLLGLYVRGKVPNEALVPILAFISARLHHQSATAGNAGSAPSYQSTPTTVQDFLDVLIPFEHIPGRTMHQLFVHELWNMKTLEDLHDFFR